MDDLFAAEPDGSERLFAPEPPELEPEPALFEAEPEPALSAAEPEPVELPTLFPVEQPDPLAEALQVEDVEPLEFPSGKVLAVVNQKGGVGKTTTTINLGVALAQLGARVLLVDFDPQGALSVGLGLSNPNSLDATVYNLLLDPNTTLDEVRCNSQVEGLDIVPANIDLSAAEIVLVSEVAREQLLGRRLEEARKAYNYILIDCPPSLGLLTVNALTAADGVVIPVECEFFALRGMALLIETIDKVRERLNARLEITGIVATMFDARTIHGREVLSRIADGFESKLFKTVIHKTIKFAEAPVVGKSILDYAPRSAGAQEYRDLAREVVNR